MNAAELLNALKNTDHPTKTTEVLQRAIDDTAEQGGGLVLVPPGTWTICTLLLRSNITLHLQRGCVLQAHDDLGDYPTGQRGHNKDRTAYHLIVADGCERLTIEGDGVIDGRGELFWERPLRDLKAEGVDISEDIKRAPRHWPIEGPFYRGWNPRISPMIELRHCTDLVLRDVVIRNSPGWTVHPFCCDRVRIEGIVIDDHMYGPNTDGIDVNGCRDVLINNCRIVGCDDSIILKATPDARTCERIAVTNCTLKTNCAALGLGAETTSGIRDVTFSNCVVEQALRMIQFEMWAPGFIENVTVNNITGRCMVPSEIPQEKVIYADIQHHGRGPDSELGSMRNIVISGITAETKGRGVLLTAADGAMIENVTIRDVHLTYPQMEDQTAQAKICKSSQNSNDNPWAQAMNSVVVAENVRGLWLENVRAQTPPADGKMIPEYRAVAARNLQQGVIDCPWLASNGELDSVLLEACDDVDVRAIG
ncbi:MAG: glycoside hydrolase family 28 protein [Phycisphaerae bacterium]